MPHFPRIGLPKSQRPPEQAGGAAQPESKAAPERFSGRAVYARANTKGTVFGGHAIYDAPYEDGKPPKAFYENVHRGMRRSDKPQAQDYTQATPSRRKDAHAYTPIDTHTRNPESVYETPRDALAAEDHIYDTPPDALSTADGFYEPLDPASRETEPLYETSHLYENSDEAPEPTYEPMSSVTSPLERTVSTETLYAEIDEHSYEPIPSRERSSSAETLYTDIDEPIYDEIPARSGGSARDGDEPVYDTIAERRRTENTQNRENPLLRAFRFITRGARTPSD